MKTILVAEKTTAEVRDMLREAAGKAAELVFAETQDVTREQVLDCDALLGNIKPALLEDAPRLAWVQLMSSGADVYAGHAPLKNAFTLTTATGAYGVGIAEYMVCMLLTMMKKIPTYLDQQKAGVWRDAGEVVSPMGKRVLIVGTGNLGTEFARRMRPFGCTIVGVRRRSGDCPPEYDAMRTLDALSEELPLADVVALCLPGTSETYHLFDQAMLARCKPGAFLMNVGRGTVIPRAALLDAETVSRFGGVWVDVLETEPLPDGDALFGVENLIITPHITGGWHLDETRRRIFALCAENLRRWLSGEALKRVMDWDTGYCK
ncbi:MAG: D-2-hydroxyacid dehydrogenase [Oscillospiraceae bacterium]|nr:D-2-hydroxyacid dehydrogenase [Oscillospiraceae bacterium]